MGGSGGRRTGEAREIADSLGVGMDSLVAGFKVDGLVMTQSMAKERIL